MVTNVWGNATINDLIHDAEKALNVLLQQPEVDPKRISLIGHSEGTIYAPRIAIYNSTKVKNVILMAALAATLWVSSIFKRSAIRSGIEICCNHVNDIFQGGS